MSLHSAPDGRVPRGQARKRVVSAATELFARQGYEATTIRQIVTEARVTPGALYHWFSSKEELLTSIYTDLLTDQTRRLERISASPKPAAERLREAAFDLVAHIADHGDQLAVWARSVHLVRGEQAAATRRDRRRYHELFRDLVQEAQKAGAVRADVSASIIAHNFLSSLSSVHTWFRDSGPLSRHEVGRQLAILFLSSLQPEPVTTIPAGAESQRLAEPGPAVRISCDERFQEPFLDSAVAPNSPRQHLERPPGTLLLSTAHSPLPADSH